MVHGFVREPPNTDTPARDSAICGARWAPTRAGRRRLAAFSGNPILAPRPRTPLADGSFVYDGGEQYGPGKTDDDTYYGKSGYYGLSPTASYVLTYSLPYRKLLITGRGGSSAPWLSKKDVAEAIASGRFDVDRETKSTKEIVAALRDWSPVVRGWAAEELAKRPEAKEMVPQLIAMAEGSDATTSARGRARRSAISRAPRRLPVLVRLLTHEDRWLRVKAANALKNMGDTAKPVIPDMLKAVAVTAEPLQPIVWADPIQLTHGELAAALFKGLLRGSVKDIDPALLYPAIARFRGTPMEWLEPRCATFWKTSCRWRTCRLWRRTSLPP